MTIGVPKPQKRADPDGCTWPRCKGRATINHKPSGHLLCWGHWKLYCEMTETRCIATYTPGHSPAFESDSGAAEKETPEPKSKKAAKSRKSKKARAALSDTPNGEVIDPPTESLTSLIETDDNGDIIYDTA